MSSRNYSSIHFLFFAISTARPTAAAAKPNFIKLPHPNPPFLAGLYLFNPVFKSIKLSSSPRVIGPGPALVT